MQHWRLSCTTPHAVSALNSKNRSATFVCGCACAVYLVTHETLVRLFSCRTYFQAGNGTAVWTQLSGELPWKGPARSTGRKTLILH